jgi:sialidase-1
MNMNARFMLTTIRTSHLLRSVWYLSLILLTTSFCQSDAGAATPSVFVAGEDGYACFRIPAVVATANGHLLAFAEGRKKGCSDTGDIDLVMKRSIDYGQIWGPLQVVWDDGENTCGNPAPVMDVSTGRILLLSTWNLGSDREKEIINLTSEDTRHVFVLSSEDEGTSWTLAEEITDSVKLPSWTWYATGPGSGIQMRQGRHKGRLIVACDHIEAETKRYFSHIIYSDDGGDSWRLGGSTPTDQVNECEVAELSDGRLLLNMRNYNRKQKNRQLAHSEDGGLTWSTPFFHPTLVEPICQASMQTFEAAGRNLLLFSNPASQDDRVNMTVRVSEDDGKSWPHSLVLHEGPSAYSDLVGLPGNRIGCLYERGKDSPYEAIVFQTVTLANLESR